MLPVNVTVSVTNMCNSKCRTCFIWNYYAENPNEKDREFRAKEFSGVFESLGQAPYWFTMSGGEPFLRRDLPEICEAAAQYCEPSIISIPSNGLLPEIVKEETEKILKRIGKTTLIVNLSLDGLEEEHDEIRGVKGNFKLLMETYKGLWEVKKNSSNLQLGFHSVVSKFNVNSLMKLYDYVRALEPDSYITEMAEERAELFNLGKGIAPDPQEYENFVMELSKQIKSDYLRSSRKISRFTQAFRLRYYQTASRWLWERRQQTPCYAGYASCQITPFGDVWPCCTLGYDKRMGNVREHNYDFRKVWFSAEADRVRRFVKAGNCSCPLANAHYTNMLCDATSILHVLRYALNVT